MGTRQYGPPVAPHTMMRLLAIVKGGPPTVHTQETAGNWKVCCSVHGAAVTHLYRDLVRPSCLFLNGNRDLPFLKLFLCIY